MARWMKGLLIGLVVVNTILIGALQMHWNPRQPNILLVTVDTYRADYVHCFGGRYPTPTFDALAARGIMCERAYSQADVTPESHMTLMASRRLTNLLDDGRHAVLGDVLHQAGYRTGAVISAGVVDRNVTVGGVPFTQGIDDFFSLGSSEATPGKPALTRHGRETNDLALQWLDRQAEANIRTPWFLWVHYYDMHQPIDIPEQWLAGDDKVDSDYSTRYGHASSYVDSLAGELMAKLKASGMDDNTIVVVTGDHGESLGQHDLLYSHAGMYDSITRVPLIVALPKGPAGVRLSSVSENIDIAPTVLEAAGIKVPAGMQGRNLVEQVETAGVRAAVAQTGRMEARMVTDGRWKLIAYDRDLTVPPDWFPMATRTVMLDRPRAVYRAAGTRELFNLKDDPSEHVNLLDKNPEMAKRMGAALDTATSGADHVNGRDPELEERLKALGY